MILHLSSSLLTYSSMCIFSFPCGCVGGNGAVSHQPGCNLTSKPCQKCQKNVEAQEKNPWKRDGPCPICQHANSISSPPILGSEGARPFPSERLSAQSPAAISHGMASSNGTLPAITEPSISQTVNVDAQTSTDTLASHLLEKDLVPMGGELGKERPVTSQNGSSVLDTPTDASCGNDKKKCCIL